MHLASEWLKQSRMENAQAAGPGSPCPQRARLCASATGRRHKPVHSWLRCSESLASGLQDEDFVVDEDGADDDDDEEEEDEEEEDEGEEEGDGDGSDADDGERGGYGSEGRQASRQEGNRGTATRSAAATQLPVSVAASAVATHGGEGEVRKELMSEFAGAWGGLVWQGGCRHNVGTNNVLLVPTSHVAAAHMPRGCVGGGGDIAGLHPVRRTQRRTRRLVLLACLQAPPPTCVSMQSFGGLCPDW